VAATFLTKGIFVMDALWTKLGGKQEEKKNKRKRRKEKTKTKTKTKTKEKTNKEKRKPNLGDVVSTPRDGVETSVGAMSWRRPVESCGTPLEPRCGVGQWDIELHWSRVAASANGT
jgi:hypothetical protein